MIATTQFWLLGKGANYSGKVEFSDADTQGLRVKKTLNAGRFCL